MLFEVLFFWLVGSSLSVDCYVIHVYCECPLCDLFMKNGVHHGLEGCWWVSESKEHHRWFEESLIGYEGCFMLVFLDDLYSVISLADVDCGD